MATFFINNNKTKVKEKRRYLLLSGKQELNWIYNQLTKAQQVRCDRVPGKVSLYCQYNLTAG